MNSNGLGQSATRLVMGLSFFRGFIEQARLSWLLFRDPRVPVVTKAIPVATIIYLVSPADWLVNLLPILGQMQDVAVLGLGLTLFIRAAPQAIVNEHLAQLRSGNQSLNA